MDRRLMTEGQKAADRRTEGCGQRDINKTVDSDIGTLKGQYWDLNGVSRVRTLEHASDSEVKLEGRKWIGTAKRKEENEDRRTDEGGGRKTEQGEDGRREHD